MNDPNRSGDASKKMHELEQNLALMADNLPPCWKRMYDNILATGFSEDQSFKILLTHIAAQCGGNFKV